MKLICMRIFSDFNRKIITACVDICELQILMNVLRGVRVFHAYGKHVPRCARATMLLLPLLFFFLSVPHSQCVLSNIQTECVITYWAVIKLTFVVTYGGFLENLHPRQINAVYIFFVFI